MKLPQNLQGLHSKLRDGRSRKAYQRRVRQQPRESNLREKGWSWAKWKLGQATPKVGPREARGRWIMLRSTGTNAWSRRSWAVSRSISLGQHRWLAQEKESRWSKRGAGRQKQEQMEVEYLALGLIWRTSRNYRIKFKTYGKSKPKAHGLRPRAHLGTNPKAQEPLKHRKQQEDPRLWTRDSWHTFDINRNQRLAQPPRCRCLRPKFMNSYQLWIYSRITCYYGRISPLTLTLVQHQ